MPPSPPLISASSSPSRGPARQEKPRGPNAAPTLQEPTYTLRPRKVSTCLGPAVVPDGAPGSNIIKNFKVVAAQVTDLYICYSVFSNNQATRLTHMLV